MAEVSSNLEEECVGQVSLKEGCVIDREGGTR